MTYGAIFSTALFLLSASSHAALQGSDCAARSEKIAAAKRVSFMKDCLENVRKPENVKEIERKQKNTLCEQNAKGMKLKGSEKVRYETNCVNRNEAAVEAKNKHEFVIHLRPRASAKGPSSKDTPQKNSVRRTRAKPKTARPEKKVE